MKKLFLFLLILIFIASAFAGCLPEDESTDISANESANISEEVSANVSEEVSNEVSEEASAEASTEVSENSGDDTSVSEIIKALAGRWESTYTEEDCADGYVDIDYYSFSESGVYEYGHGEYMVYTNDNGELELEGYGGQNYDGTYTIEGNKLILVTGFTIEHGPGGDVDTYEITITDDIMMMNNTEFVKTSSDTSRMPDLTTEKCVYGLWANNEPDGDAYNRQWWKIEENGNCEHGTGRFIKAASNDTDTVVINGENYKMESGEVIKGTFTVFGGYFGEFKFTANGEEHVYYVSVEGDWLSMYFEQWEDGYSYYIGAGFKKQ